MSVSGAPEGTLGTPPGTRTFPAAPLDRLTRGTTGLFLCILAVASATSTVALLERATSATRLLIVPAASAIAAAVWACAPAAYEVGNGQLRVRRRAFGPKTFVIQGEPKPLDPSALSLTTVRLMGSGGAFGWYGLFWRRDLGRFRAYVTDRSRLVSVPTDQGLVVVSPADQATFTKVAWR